MRGVQRRAFLYYPENRRDPVYSEDIPELFSISEEEYFEKLDMLLDIIEEFKQEFKNSGHECWTNFKFIIDKTGKFNIDFSYKDLSEVDD